VGSISQIALGLVSAFGVLGVGIGVFLNGLGIPGISELLLPLGGVGVVQGKMSLVGLVVVAMLAQLAGVSVAYFVARTGGLDLVERYGKYVLVSTRELEAAQRAFERYGQWLVVFGAFIPGVQGFIGYVAGVAKMHYGRFVASVLVGKLVWVGGLVYLGMVLGDHLDLIDRSIKQVAVVVLAAILVAGVWYVRRHRRHRRMVAAARPKGENV
jgi:membrane protein DedA with SNARE-associated domain